MRVATGRRDSFGAGLKHVDGVSAIEAGRGLADGDANELTRQRVAHENDATVISPTDGTPRRGTIHANCEKTFVTARH
jgi:hypothetical protein